MSKVVPLDQALVDEDRRYLRDLGAHGTNLEKRIDTAYPPSASAMEAFEREEQKRLAEINGGVFTMEAQNDLQAENDRLRAELEALRGPEAAPVPSEYASWSKAQLEAEIDRVNAEDSDANLAKGNKEPMAAALAAYFAD
jgi:surface antigen